MCFLFFSFLFILFGLLSKERKAMGGGGEDLGGDGEGGHHHRSTSYENFLIKNIAKKANKKNELSHNGTYLWHAM